MGKALRDMTLEELWELFPISLVEHDRDAYTNAKSEFVRRCTDAARREYPGRYDCNRAQ